MAARKQKEEEENKDTQVRLTGARTAHQRTDRRPTEKMRNSQEEYPNRSRFSFALHLEHAERPVSKHPTMLVFESSVALRGRSVESGVLVSFARVGTSCR